MENSILENKQLLGSAHTETLFLDIRVFGADSAWGGLIQIVVSQTPLDVQIIRQFSTLCKNSAHFADAGPCV